VKRNNILVLRHDIEKKLLQTYQDPTLAEQYAWWILAAITGQKKEQLIAHHDITLSDEQQSNLDDWLDKLVNKHMPIQYLFGSVPFLNLDILVEPPTLIPRPETEELCAQLIEQLLKLKNKTITILDIGTGSGCIALALAKALPKATVYATDIADAALKLAQKNAKHNTINNIIFVRSDVFDSMPENIKFDLIVSNPPYVTSQEWKKLDKSVTEWEDQQALVANHEGVAIIERIIDGAPTFLKENAAMERLGIAQLIIEIGHKQGPVVADLFKKANFDAITVNKDLEGKDRVVTGRVKHVAIQSKKE